MTKRAKPSGLYLTAIERFAETEECSPVELVAGRASVQEISERCGKIPGAIAKDINRVDLESCKPIHGKGRHFLDRVSGPRCVALQSRHGVFGLRVLTSFIDTLCLRRKGYDKSCA